MGARAMRMELAVVATALLVGAAGCGANGDPSGNATTTADPAASDTAAAETAPAEGSGATVTNREWSRVWKARADGFGTDPVELAGLVYGDTGASLLVYGKPDDKGEPAEVSGNYPGVRKNDYVLVKGTISGAGRYGPAAGRKAEVVTIDGVSVTPIGRDRALALAHPATGGERRLGLRQSRGHLEVGLRSIEWTKHGTRLTVTLTNRGSSKARISASKAVIQQGPRKHRLAGGDEGARALSVYVRPGATKSGTMTFDQISRKRGKAYVAFDWHSHRHKRETTKPFAFTMKWTP
jgi:hypothetical protein